MLPPRHNHPRRVIIDERRRASERGHMTRVARGLFRLWLVLSVLWIAGVGVVTWQTFPEEPWGLHDPIVEETDLTAPSKRPSGAFDPDKYLAAKVAAERRSAVWHGSLLAILPPAFVLALGSSLVWAFRGFQ